MIGVENNPKDNLMLHYFDIGWSKKNLIIETRYYFINYNLGSLKGCSDSEKEDDSESVPHITHYADLDPIKLNQINEAYYHKI